MEPDGYIEIEYVMSPNRAVQNKEKFYFRHMKTWRKSDFGVEVLRYHASGVKRPVTITVPWNNIRQLTMHPNSEEFVEHERQVRLNEQYQEEMRQVREEGKKR